MVDFPQDPPLVLYSRLLVHQVEWLSEEIWIFGALCLYWCDVELHIYPIWFLEIQFWERKFLVLISGDSFWERRFPVLISGNLHLERLYHLGFWKSMRSMVMLQRGVRRNGVLDMHGFLRT